MTTLARTSVAARRSVPPFDFVLVGATLLVSFIGVVMVYTATRGPLLAAGDDPKTFLKKQGLFASWASSSWWCSPCSTTAASNR